MKENHQLKPGGRRLQPQPAKMSALSRDYHRGCARPTDLQSKALKFVVNGGIWPKFKLKQAFVYVLVTRVVPESRKLSI